MPFLRKTVRVKNARLEPNKEGGEELSDRFPAVGAMLPVVLDGTAAFDTHRRSDD